MKVAFHTLGCKVNQYETNAMIQKFLEKDYELVDFAEIADIYIVNTCTVTNISDKKSRQMLRKVKEQNNECVIVATGCYAQVARNEIEKIDEIDLVLGNNEKKDIVKYIEEYLITKNKLEVITDVLHKTDFVDLGIVTHTETTRAFIKIQDGCNNFCTYCIIPYARGGIRSRDKNDILKEINNIVSLGIKEVVLTGIHIASYGKEKNDEYYLIDLIEDINKIHGLERIRLGSLEPKIITEEFARRLKKVGKICEHFHLSLQSGCNETLKRMNRKYSIEEFEECTKILRASFENVSLTTDIIVGFPGETDEEFKKTYDFLKHIKFLKMHIFKYSKRNGTPAAIMKNQIDGNIKEQRSQKLIELSNNNEREILNKYIGKNLKVLFEEEKNGYWIGHTMNYLVVKVKCEKNIENFILNVKIVETKNLDLIGFLVI